MFLGLKDPLYLKLGGDGPSAQSKTLSAHTSMTSTESEIIAWRLQILTL